jgi:hypothetical protein
MLRVRPTETPYKDPNQSPAASAVRRETELLNLVVWGAALSGGMSPEPK